ncbi:helix-turn-helix domain-containing protein [Amycolatopsis sp. cmx-8-4]|uniref:helix-turn-helix domain-containing protein n=1 Tax=Amycolatopsis sp. cmx-8-4 TaxID=2790947 RepID=UPI0039783BBE
MATSQPAPLPVQKRAWDTRERILAAAVACLAEDGYAATTTSRIQERAGVSRGSLLRRFHQVGDVGGRARQRGAHGLERPVSGSALIS